VSTIERLSTEDAWLLSFELVVCILLTALLLFGWLFATSYGREGASSRPPHALILAAKARSSYLMSMLVVEELGANLNARPKNGAGQSAAEAAAAGHAIRFARSLRSLRRGPRADGPARRRRRLDPHARGEEGRPLGRQRATHAWGWTPALESPMAGARFGSPPAGARPAAGVHDRAVRLSLPIGRKTCAENSAVSMRRRR
jgi:hypothetical protein